MNGRIADFGTAPTKIGVNGPALVGPVRPIDFRT